MQKNTHKGKTKETVMETYNLLINKKANVDDLIILNIMLKEFDFVYAMQLLSNMANELAKNGDANSLIKAKVATDYFYELFYYYQMMIEEELSNYVDKTEKVIS